MEETPKESRELDTLEGQETDVSVGSITPATDSSSTPAAAPKQPETPGNRQKISLRTRGLITRINIYLLIMVLLMVVAIVVVVVSLQRNRRELAPPTITTQELTQEALEQINDSEITVGDPKQVLTVASNAIFSGKVLIRDSLDVAGTIKVGGALNLPGLTVAGTSTFDQLQANRISVSGDGAVQGTLSVQKGLTVAGGATFGGNVSAPQITAQSLQLNGDLTFTRHVDAGGPTPGKSDGTALGNGGTASVGGTDSAGTATINTGSGPGAGCFITINFAAKYNGTPHVVITPVGSSAAGLSYYINRSSTNFSICTTSPPPASASFAFDYIVID